MLALTSLILSTKKELKLLQSLFEKTGTSGGAGVTVLLMVSNRTLGLRLLEEIMLAKEEALTSLTMLLNSVKRSL